MINNKCSIIKYCKVLLLFTTLFRVISATSKQNNLTLRYSNVHNDYNIKIFWVKFIKTNRTFLPFLTAKYFYYQSNLYAPAWIIIKSNLFFHCNILTFILLKLRITFLKNNFIRTNVGWVLLFSKILNHTIYFKRNNF